MVGASYSEVSTPVSTVLQGHNISMLSYASTTATLSDKSRHPLFGRLVPSDIGQVQAVYDLAIALEWKSVDLITADGSGIYGRSLLDAFVTVARPKKISGKREMNICSFYE